MGALGSRKLASQTQPVVSVGLCAVLQVQTRWHHTNATPSRRCGALIRSSRGQHEGRVSPRKVMRCIAQPRANASLAASSRLLSARIVLVYSRSRRREEQASVTIKAKREHVAVRQHGEGLNRDRCQRCCSCKEWVVGRSPASRCSAARRVAIRSGVSCADGCILSRPPVMVSRCRPRPGTNSTCFC